jgi:putative transcriptional regulator
MMRVRLKADGRLVEILADGSEQPLLSTEDLAARKVRSPSIVPPADTISDADYARRVRAATRLTQAEFAARISVPIETVRNWEQGKRSPRGPARALLKVIEKAPEVAFKLLSN